MKVSTFFKPKDEVFNALSYKDQKKVFNVITGGLIASIMFVCLFLLLLVMKKFRVGLLLIIPIILFFSPLIFIKKGKTYAGSWVTSLGILFACVVICFGSTRQFSPTVSYRAGCFCAVMAVYNYMICMKKKQQVIFGIASIAIAVGSVPALYYQSFSGDMKEWIIGILINFLGLILCNSILIASVSLYDDIVAHSEEEHKQVAEDLDMITHVLSKSKESMNVGQELNDAAGEASDSVEKITDVYKDLIVAANKLEEQIVNVKNASSVVNKSSDFMTKSIDIQNHSLNEMSIAMTEISSNLSSIDEIAEKRRAGMAAVTKLLDDQAKLITKLVEEVEMVKSSSDSVQAFVQTVDSIAGQTSLLAMNASIEAAHAGENGKGFSVIAQEIRKLSEETTRNAEKIEDTLNQNSVVVKETADSVRAVANATKKSTEEIRATIISMEEILRGIKEMDEGTQGVMRTVTEIVNQSHDSTKVINEVVNQINEQGSSINIITESTDSLKVRVESINEIISEISNATDKVYNTAKKNEEVSSTIAELLK